MKQIAVITGITILWCAVLAGAAIGFLTDQLHIVKGGAIATYIVAGALIFVAVLAFFHTMVGLILTIILAGYGLLVDIPRLFSEGISHAWLGLTVGACGILYVWVWFRKRKVLKEMAKERA